MHVRSALLGIALAASAARAQPVTHPDDVPPLAQIRDDEQLAAALVAITQDPAIRVVDDTLRPLAAALLAEGVRQVRAQAYERALANFLDAYARFPSPKILLDIASALRDMGRLAEAANSYQRYLADPATGLARVTEVKQILLQLDARVALLAVRVEPRGSEVSIDGGPFVAVGSALVTRVRPGPHTIRVRNGEAIAELSLEAFEGETRDVTVEARLAARAPAGAPALPTARTPEEVAGWLVVGREFGASDTTTNRRTINAGFSGPIVAAIVPELPREDDDELVPEPEATTRRIASGLVGVMRIDGKARGAAGGLGVALAPSDALELEVMGVRSNVWGLYAGMRVRFLTGRVRPYAAAGVPLFFFENEQNMSAFVALGVRGAGGVELRLNGHVSVKADLGLEHFFNLTDVLLDGKRPEATLFVPTLGAIGRL